MKHGFNTDGQITDDILLDTHKDIIEAQQENLYYVHYIEWKVDKLRRIISATAGTKSLEEQDRLTYRLKALKYNETILFLR